MVNTFSGTSGPNCFAAAAASTPAKGRMHYRQWLHWIPFSRFLSESDYCCLINGSPEAGDILVFVRKDQVIHVAYCLGSGLCFEKSGQDFFEPYRIQKLLNLLEEWPTTELKIWRKKPAHNF
jgi:hypothetical protein